MTEEQRMEEGRRMFQIFAARMFEQRVLSAYRERVAIERQKRLLEEVEEESRKAEEQKERKAREKEKKNAKRKAQKEAKEAELKEKAEKKAREEAEKKAEEERKAEEARRRKEEQRLKREAEKKAADEERLRKEEEKKKRLQEEREREHEKERKRKEQLEVEKKKKAELARKQKEEKDQRDREKKEKDERDRKDREAKRKAAEEKDRARKEAEANVAVPKIATTPILATASKASTTPSHHSLHPPTIVPAVVSPRLAVAAPALPKQASPGKGKASTKGSVTSSPQTPKIQTRANLGTPAPMPPIPTTASTGLHQASSIANSSATSPAATAPPKQGQVPAGPPGIPPPGMPSIPSQSSTPAPPHIPIMGTPQGYPSHMSPPPGVPAPEGFGMAIPNHPFMPPGHRSGPIPLTMLPPPGQLGFGMNIFRGFPVPATNPPMPLVPPPGNLRGFPPPNTRPFMGNDFPQPLPGSTFPPPPGSPFMRQENIQTGHQRQPSGDHTESNPASTPKPIHRPTPIQRPTNAAPGGPVSKINIDELSTSLGSSALLGDDEPEEPSAHKADNASPARRGSNIPSGRGVFGIAPGSSPFFMGPDSGGQPFGGFPSPSNTWGVPSPLFNPSGPWGPPAAPAGSGWIQNATTPFGANQRRPGRIDVLRLHMISIFRHASKDKKNAEGFMPVKFIMRTINDPEQSPNTPHDVSEEELLTVTEIEGDWQNGGGCFVRHRDEDGSFNIKYILEGDQRSVSGSSGLGGTPIVGPGEIGSPVGSVASSLPFGTRQGSASSGIVGSPHF
ncbi:hypothetical protein AA313_de0206513 [Arthrobotrys entomopaga]|nr:hypothetical protein AA313_de0206513 [Arthrobotrys entomopaga]